MYGHIAEAANLLGIGLEMQFNNGFRIFHSKRNTRYVLQDLDEHVL